MTNVLTMGEGKPRDAKQSGHLVKMVNTTYLKFVPMGYRFKSGIPKGAWCLMQS
jgi:hypothetical protein